MADLLPVSVPVQFTRSGNIAHTGHHLPVPVDRHFSYRTDGFHEKAELLPFLVFRAGYLAGLRARKLNQTVGLMITASHNPKEFNGVKIVEPMGEMLSVEWETYATDLANASDERFPACVRSLENQTAPLHDCPSARVMCAQDNRDSGEFLVEAAEAGVKLFNVRFRQEGRITTPQLHYCVRVDNDRRFGPPGDMGYNQRLSEAFNALIQLLPPSVGNYTPQLHLDCANGIGAHMMHYLARFLGIDVLNIEYHNEFGDLNHLCGADFVHSSQQLPTDFDGLPALSRCASLDGDADRLIYFYTKEDRKSLQILDGDKIAVLFARYFIENLIDAGLAPSFTMAVVQTAYANGAATKYIRETLNLPTVCVPAGVQHLQSEASRYDIGIYFEANGHGTVCFSDKFKRVIESAAAGAGVVVATGGVPVGGGGGAISPSPSLNGGASTSGASSSGGGGGSSSRFSAYATAAASIAAAGFAAAPPPATPPALNPQSVAAAGVVTANALSAAVQGPASLRAKTTAAKRLLHMSLVINELVGDAMADLLAVELCLRYFGWSVTDWASNLYTDLPNRLIKQAVPDRSIFCSTADETRLVQPVFLQDHIDKLIIGCGDQARAFVRPSGTENVVRVYAEALTQQMADTLAEAITEVVRHAVGMA